MAKSDKDIQTRTIPSTLMEKLKNNDDFGLFTATYSLIQLYKSQLDLPEKEKTIIDQFIPKITSGKLPNKDNKEYIDKLLLLDACSKVSLLDILNAIYTDLSIQVFGEMKTGFDSILSKDELALIYELEFRVEDSTIDSKEFESLKFLCELSIIHLALTKGLDKYDLSKEQIIGFIKGHDFKGNKYSQDSIINILHQLHDKNDICFIELLLLHKDEEIRKIYTTSFLGMPLSRFAFMMNLTFDRKAKLMELKKLISSHPELLLSKWFNLNDEQRNNINLTNSYYNIFKFVVNNCSFTFDYEGDDPEKGKVSNIELKLKMNKIKHYLKDIFIPKIDDILIDKNSIVKRIEEFAKIANGHELDIDEKLNAQLFSQLFLECSIDYEAKKNYHEISVKTNYYSRQIDKFNEFTLGLEKDNLIYKINKKYTKLTTLIDERIVGVLEGRYDSVRNIRNCILDKNNEEEIKVARFQYIKTTYNNRKDALNKLSSSLEQIINELLINEESYNKFNSTKALSEYKKACINNNQTKIQDLEDNIESLLETRKDIFSKIDKINNGIDAIFAAIVSISEKEDKSERHSKIQAIKLKVQIEEYESMRQKEEMERRKSIENNFREIYKKEQARIEAHKKWLEYRQTKKDSQEKAKKEQEDKKEKYEAKLGDTEKESDERPKVLLFNKTRKETRKEPTIADIAKSQMVANQHKILINKLSELLSKISFKIDTFNVEHFMFYQKAILGSITNIMNNLMLDINVAPNITKMLANLNTTPKTLRNALYHNELIHCHLTSDSSEILFKYWENIFDKTNSFASSLISLSNNNKLDEESIKSCGIFINEALTFNENTKAKETAIESIFDSYTRFESVVDDDPDTNKFAYEYTSGCLGALFSDLKNGNIESRATHKSLMKKYQALIDSKFSKISAEIRHSEKNKVFI